MKKKKDKDVEEGTRWEMEGAFWADGNSHS